MNRRTIALSAVFAAALLLVASGACQTVRPANHLRLLEPVPLPSAEVAQGQVLFMRYCHTCHPDGDSGLGPALYSTPLPAVRAQVRLGVGGMPSFSDEVLADDEVDAILVYLDTLRDHVKEP